MQKYFTLWYYKKDWNIIEQISGLFVYVICSIQFEKLDSDLKNYKSNSIKESIR